MRPSQIANENAVPLSSMVSHIHPSILLPRRFLLLKLILVSPGNWSAETFVSSYVNLPIFAALYFGYKFIRKTSIVPLDKIPIRQFIQIANDNTEPEPPAKTGWHKYNFLWE